MNIRYVPILRWKRGERVGLNHASPPAKARCLPIFLLGTDQFSAKKATKNTPIVPAPDAFIQELIHQWGSTAFALDASSISSPTTHHALMDIATAARAAGAALIPATNLAASLPYQTAVTSCLQNDKRGVVLRVDLQEATTIQNWIGQWPFKPNETDLVVDFGETISQAAALGPVLVNVFQQLHLGQQWRSVTMAGTAMPQNFQGYKNGLHLVGRTEYALWQQLQTATLPYQLDFGDFASVSPGSAPPVIAWGYPISVRYTLANDYLICRGVRTTGPLAVNMGPQLVQHAKDIVAWPSRGGLTSSWADITIDKIATGNAPPKSLEHWVQLGVCRHIDLVHSMLP